MPGHIEFETTFSVGTDAVLPDLADLAPGGIERRSHELDATYFDTGDLRLAARRVTLRRRTGGTDAGWHLKVPWGEGAKREFHVPLGSDPDTVPGELADLARAAARGAALRPVARIATRRTESALLDAGGTPLVLVADDTVTGEAVGAAPTTWREVEVERADGDSALQERVGERLAAAGAVPSATGSKLLTVLGDRVPRPVPRPSGDTAGEVVRAYLWDQVEHLLAHDPPVRLDEPDAVHQMRVATRRLRAVLQVFPSVLRRDATRPVADELRRLSGVLAPARDLEVLRERCEAWLDTLPESAAGHGLTGTWLAAVDDHRAVEARRIAQELAGTRYLALLDALDALRTGPPLTGRAGERARTVLADDLTRACRRAADARDHATAARDADTRVTAWHEVRKAAKRTRYAATLAAPVLGGPAKRVRSWASRLQEVLGEHQDGVALRGYLEEHAPALVAAGDDRDAVLVTLGALAGAEAGRGTALIEEAARAWSAGPDPREPLAAHTRRRAG
ncbi:CYTH and CHAD domain-containing protein [Nocardiopsis aegyptia]|uniref:CHAD domain-containing protein n=1 Tax=Nocardiopsis aegyptia TaxID=220378 RepID=A0A7Z0J7P4_9ACTN|nr:CYTH and CHAD domain-containing protein [Nocardiopsis aegyptia]NYJ32238.1 CHAD domain-containing protein [Nocardiopsis aegyptia]